MKILVVGASGTIGKEVVRLLAPRHDVVKVGHRSGDFQVDLGSKDSIEILFKEVSSVDAVISTAGLAKFGRLNDLTDEDYQLGLQNKLMGQVNLARIGRKYITEGGSITLTSGVLGRKPIPGSAAISMVNAGLEGFVRAVALEMERGIRINVVSPIFATETLSMLGMDPSQGMPAANFASAYKESVEGHRNGEVIDVQGFA